MFEDWQRFLNNRRNSKAGDSQRMNLMDQVEFDMLLQQVQSVPDEERHPFNMICYERFLQFEMLMPIPAGTDIERELPILAMENGHGETGLPLFTSEAAVADWSHGEGESVDYVVLPFKALCSLAVEAGVDYLLVNASGAYGCEITFHDFSYLAEGLLPPPPGDRNGGELVIEKDTPMRLAECRELSDGLMERLHAVFNHHHDKIQWVYLFEVGFNEGPLQPALGIRLAPQWEFLWEEGLWPSVQAVLSEMLDRREVINVFLLNQTGSLEEHVRQFTEPMYTGDEAEMTA